MRSHHKQTGATGLDNKSSPAPRALLKSTKPLMTVKEVAAFLHVSDKTVMRMVRNGELPFVRIRRYTRFIPDDIERYLNSVLSKNDGADLHHFIANKIGPKK